LGGLTVNKGNKVFTIKRGFVRGIVYHSNKIGAIIMTDEIIPNKELPTLEKKEVVTNWLIKKGFNVSMDSF
jgi:hypothetical protein